MDDLERYIDSRKRRSKRFARSFDRGYGEFKIGAMLRAAREEAGLTQEELAKKLHTKKSAVSRIENHAEDMKLSTIGRFADAVGKNLELQFNRPHRGQWRERETVRA